MNSCEEGCLRLNRLILRLPSASELQRKIFPSLPSSRLPMSTLLTCLLSSKRDIDSTGTFETYERLWLNLSSTSHSRPLLLLLSLSMRWCGLEIEVTMYTVFYWITASFFKCCFCWRMCLILSLNPISNPMTVFICSSLFGTSSLAANKCPPRKRHLRMCLFTASSGKYFCVFLFAIRSW